MNELSKPVYALTIEEYKQLHKELLEEQLMALVPKLQNTVPEGKEKDIIFLEEAMEITGYKKPTMYSKICKYEIPVLSRRKPLTFSKKVLIQWIIDGKPNALDMEADQHIKDNL